MTHSAEIVEVFSSPQGEGPRTGERMTFVRFGRCTMRCAYCDTPKGICHKGGCLIESPAGSGNFREISNPVGVTPLCDLLTLFGNETISVTGGEPLEQVAFLAEWLPHESAKRQILLETNGVHHAELDLVLPFVHIVSMDFKLPSAAGVKPLWNEHMAFLQKAVESGKETYVKIVVTAGTTDNDLQRAIKILAGANKYIPIILQPVSQTLTFNDPITNDRLHSLKRLCHAYLPDVRVMPQMHKEWGVL